MKKRIPSALVQNSKKKNFSQKSLSLSKFNSTESQIKANPKNDYFSLLTQVKNQNIKLGTPPTLFHYFIKKNAQKSLNIRLSYLARRESQTSLLTDNLNTNNPKNISIPKATFNFSFKNQNINNNNKTETPEVPVNKLLKLKKDKKVTARPLTTKKYIPIERRESYKDYVNKMNQYTYMQYSNSNSDFVHQIKTEIYLTQGNEKEKREKRRNDKYLQYLRDKLEEKKEREDKVFYPSLEFEKLKKKIKAILLKEAEEKPEAFFNIFENKINFLEDTYKPPNIKNNLINNKYKDLYGYDQLFGLSCMNRMSKNTLKNLSKAKVRVQREKEIKLNFLREKDKIKKKYFYYKKLSKKDIYNSKEEIEQMIYKKYYIKQEDWDRILKEEQKMLNDDNMADYQNYFDDKYENNREVCIPDERIRKICFSMF